MILRLLLPFFGLLVSCGSSVGVGGSGSLASVTVENSSVARVRAATLGVFTEEGFDKRSETPAAIEFEKDGGRSAEIAWKTVGNSNPVMIRPTVRWSDAGAGTLLLRCEVEVAQQSTVYGETLREPAWVGKGAYQNLLKEVKRRAEAGG